MLTLTANEYLHEIIAYVLEPAEIRDATGKVLGHYSPQVPAELQELYAKLAAEIDHDEMDRRAESDRPRYTTEQVIEYLRQLEQAEHDLHGRVGPGRVPDVGGYLEQRLGPLRGDRRVP